MFNDLLNSLAFAHALSDGRFSARNFLLESNIPGDRVRQYLGRPDQPLPSGDDLHDLQQFSYFQNNYLSEELRLGVRTDAFDATHADCPETFRPGRSLVEFGGADDNLLLVRMDDISFIADHAGVSELEMLALLETLAPQVRSGKIDATLRSTCGNLLRKWQDSVDNRPLFTGFWEGAELSMRDPKPGWATELRDRFGLVHYDSMLRHRTAGIPAVLFRYPVTLIPRSSPGGPRFLVRPTVLDAPLNEAFYTAPPSSGIGSTVDLTIRDDDPWLELLHPAIQFRPEHVWAVDTVTFPSKDELAAARGRHVLKVCNVAPNDFVDLCQVVDGDLI
jgi:hypothetical protein